ITGLHGLFEDLRTIRTAARFPHWRKLLPVQKQGRPVEQRSALRLPISGWLHVCSLSDWRTRLDFSFQHGTGVLSHEQLLRKGAQVQRKLSGGTTVFARLRLCVGLLCLKSPRLSLDRVSTGSGSDL